MILPAKPLIAALSALFICAIIASFNTALLPVWYAFVAIIIIWLLADLFLLSRMLPPEVSRKVSNSLSLGVWTNVDLHLRAQDEHALSVHIFDHYPSCCSQIGLPVKLKILPKKQMLLTYRVQPLVRGDFEFGQVEIRLCSKLRAWQRQGKIGVSQKVLVYPNFSFLSRNSLQATACQMIGTIKRRQRGQGMDFKQLREYQEGDSQRQIDWNATSRVGKMISREYQDERDQRILLMIDCGRRMAAHDGTSSHFDYVLNAVLLMSYVGLSHGDSVGLTTIGGEELFLSPQRSSSTINLILNNLYDLQPTLQCSDFELAAQKLMMRERKRSLVILFTNLRDEDDQSLLAAANLLGKRHLVLIASLREKELDEAQNISVRTLEDATLRAAALEYRIERDAVISRLKANGVLCLDTNPKNLAIDAVNRYLKIKADGRL